MNDQHISNPTSRAPLELSSAKQALLELRKKKVGTGERIPRASYRGSGPLSYPQELLWVMDQLYPQSLAYCVPRAMRVLGKMDVAALQKALDKIIERHEILRSTYAADEGTPVQIVHPAKMFPLEVVDLTGEDQQRVQECLVTEARKPFDLARDLMLRAKLYRISELEHVLFLNTHHIASDGISRGILFKELNLLYEHFMGEKQEPGIAELPIQYLDFALWQRRTLQGKNIEADLDFWKKQLAGAPATLDLPSDRPRPAVQSFEGSREHRLFPLALLRGLLKISQQENATFFVTMLAAFQAFLFRYSGQPDILVGTPVSGRERAEIGALIGYFSNTLVLRTRFSQDFNFRALVGCVRETAFSAYSHQELPFEKLVTELNPQRNLSYSPVFQVMLALNPETPDLALGGLKIEPIKIDRGAEKFDLLVGMTQTPDGLAVSFEYSSDLFSQTRITGMMQNFETFLESIIADPDRRISALDLLPDPERDKLLRVWNRTGSDFPDTCVHRLISQQARRTPDSIAARFEDRELTYQQLDSRSDRLARVLIERGVKHNSLVGICLERSLEMLVTALAIWKTGAAYVPLDPAYPAERLAWIMEDAHVTLLVTEKHLLPGIASSSAPVFLLDDDSSGIGLAACGPVNVPSRPSDLAYVIYTSGSTGKPKGVAIEHRSVVNLLTSVSREPGMTRRDVMLAVTTLSFDIAGLELYLPLIVGGSVVIAPRESIHDGVRLAELLRSSRATIMQATPATWRMLLDSGWPGSPELKMLCGGEALPRELANRLVDCGTSLWNLYGPTETTIWSAVEAVRREEGPVLLGRPLANTYFYVLGKDLEPVPTGVTGELCIGGAGLARGYLNKPIPTSEKFVTNPFRPGERLYRTGDLARYRFDGRVEFLGRADYQVKVRGFRIELGEIEAVLEQQNGVQQAVVDAREGPSGDKRLIAFVVLNDNFNFDASSLRAALKKQLPEYMVPSEFIQLDALPLTPNGKVDRKALPRDTGPTERLSYEAPQTPLQESLAEIWSRLLGIARLGINDNFFEIGGHSLLAAQVLAEVRKNLGVQLSFRVLFEQPTVAGMAEVLGQELMHDTDGRDMELMLAQLEEGAQP